MKLSLKNFSWRFALGAEVIYLACLTYGFSLEGKGAELHRTIFETLPGFVWINPLSVLLGAIYIAVYSLAVAWFLVWAYNSSLEQTGKRQSAGSISKLLP